MSIPERTPPDSPARWWKEPDCPGGREMILEARGDGTWAETAEPDLAGG